MLNRTTYFIREHVAVLKLTDTYDILDPTNQQQIGIAKEEPSDIFKYLRLVIDKNILPTSINIYENENKPPIITVHKPFSLFGKDVKVFDNTGRLLGYMKGKFFSLGGGFWVHDANGNQVAEVKGDWKGWNFTLQDKNGREIGVITKKWAGIGKELFTSADNYIVDVKDASNLGQDANALLLAAALAIDIIYKEN